MDTLAGFGFLLIVAWVATWLIMAVAAAVFLSRHNRAGTGFFWVVLFGPIGLLMAFLKAEHLDQAQRDKDARELARHALATREQDITRAVAAALAAHRADERSPQSVAVGPATPAPTVDPALTPSPPRVRSYEEIMASEPQRPPRRFR